jgi:hypothetical protein
MNRAKRVASALVTAFLWLFVALTVLGTVSQLARGEPLWLVIARAGAVLLGPAFLLLLRYRARKPVYHPLSERIGHLASRASDTGAAPGLRPARWWPRWAPMSFVCLVLVVFAASLA